VNKDVCSFHHQLETKHWNWLKLMELILQVFVLPNLSTDSLIFLLAVQTTMSAESTPVLAGAIPSSELFMSAWQAMLADIDLQQENVGKFMWPGLVIATKYYNKMGDTDAYIIAMCKCSASAISQTTWVTHGSYQPVNSLSMD
jgi:hypothetical protein